MVKKLQIIFAFLFPYLVSAQISIKDSAVAVPMIGASFAYQLPGGNLADRFADNANVGIAFLWKTKKNWLFGADWNYLFGKNIKERGILDSIATENGYIINQNGEYAEIYLYERGFHTSLHFGKLFPVWGPNPNSGLVAIGGLGILQHKIRIEDIGNQSPQLVGDYKKGYDRLTNGLALSEFVGYVYLSNKRLLNFYVGAEFIQGFTQSRRSYDYDLRRKDTTKRTDLLYGFRLGWILPLYPKAPQEFYYY